VSTLFVLSASLTLLGCGAILLRLREDAVVPNIVRLVGFLVAPAMLTLVIFASIGEFGDIRLALQGFVFELPLRGEGIVSIGGQESDNEDEGKFSDHIRIRSIGQRSVTIGQGPDGIALTIHPPKKTPEKSKTSVVVIKSGKYYDERKLVNTYELRHGDSLLETGPKARKWTWNAVMRCLILNDEPCRVIPERMSRISIGGIKVPIFKNNNADVAIFPLRTFGYNNDNGLNEKSDITTGSFLHWGGGWFNRKVMLTISDTDLVLISNDTHHYFDPTPVAFALANEDTSAAITICRVDFRDPKDVDDAGGRVQDLRGMTLRRNSKTLTVSLETANYLTLENELFLNSPKGQAATMFLYDRRHAEMGDRSQVLLNFSACGDRLLRELYCTIKPQPDGDFIMTVPAGLRRIKSGMSFIAGERAAVILNITHLQFPVSLIFIIWAGTILTCIAGWRSCQAPLVFLLVATAQYLLAWRLLIGIEGHFLDPSVASAVSRSTAAYLVLPVLLAVLPGFTYAYKWRVRAQPNRPSAAEVLGGLIPLSTAVLCAFFLLRADASGVDPYLFAAIGATGFLVAIFWPWFVRKLSLEVADRPQGLLGPILFALSIFIFRLIALGLTGAKEALDIGGFRMTASMIADPAYALLLAMSWRLRINRMNTREASPSWRIRQSFTFLVGVFIVTGLMGITHVAVSDVGGSFILVLPALLLLPVWRSHGRFMTALKYVPVALYLILLFVWPVMHSQRTAHGLSFEDARQDRESTRQYISQRLDDDNRNYLRVLSWWSPERVRDYGTRNAEDLSIVFENMHDYATQGLWGHGFLRSRLSPALRATHLNDNLTAVHIMAPFGLLGTGSLIAVLIQFAVVPLILVRRRGRGEPTGLSVLGLICLWIIVTSGIYMIATNANLVLFTGKNAILLAAKSFGDLLHGTGLLIIAVLALAKSSERGES
jgi:hypothetical protein